MTLINTHTAVKNLIASGFTEKQSEAIVDIHNDNFTTKEQFAFLQKEIATKVDLMEVKAGLKTEIMEVKTELIGIKRDIKWIIVLLLGIFGVLIKSTFFK